ncbi:MAG TPA: DUF790 family protein [Polyangiaceae bacterium]|nr:DUF790 family protein [Polyangiaceae bacterium]
MLTSDLVRLSRRGGKVRPRFLDAKTKERLLPAARALVDVYAAAVGRTRGDLDDEAAAIPCGARDRATFLGLKKLCDDRVEIAAPSGPEPERVREVVMTLSAEAHRSPEGFDRDAVALRAAERLACSLEDIDAALFADLADAQIVAGFAPIPPEALLDRYDVALAQAVLLRAVQVDVVFREAEPARVRQLFRSARFHGLLHVLCRQDGGWRMTLDGPFSLFEAVQRYGVRLAAFLPSVLALERFELHADLRVGADRKPAEMVLSHADGLVAPREPPPPIRPEIEALLEAFPKLGSDWEIRLTDTILGKPGEPAIVPDVAFVHRRTGEEVYLELFGFWSRDAVFRRVEQIQNGLGARLILAVGKKLRVSQEVLDEDTGSSVMVFSTTLSAKEILNRLGADNQ